MKKKGNILYTNILYTNFLFTLSNMDKLSTKFTYEI